jgi:hypothetical protein
LKQLLLGYLPGIQLDNQAWRDVTLASEQRFDERRSRYGKQTMLSESQAENRQMIRDLVF